MTDIHPKTATRGRPRRTQSDTAEMRARIVRAARDLFARDGYEGVSMRKLAVATGCAPAALYAYFPNRRAILHVVWEDIFSDLAEIMEQTASAHDDPLQRLDALARTMISFWLDRPDDFRAIFLIEDKPQSPDDVYFAQTSSSLSGIDRIQSAAEEAVAADQVTLTDAARISHVVMSAITGTALNVITIPEYDWGEPDTYVDDVVTGLINGLRHRP
ncbi:MAG: TetR/AcrR family transcriptional regulator [Candidatus Phaeomarinobacter sp.]